MLRSMLVPAIVLLPIVTVSAPVAAPGQAGQVCLAIAPFQNTSDWGDNAIGLAAAAELADLLFETGEFTIVGPTEMAPVMEDLEVEAITPFDVRVAEAAGERVGCPYVLASRVSKFTVDKYSGGVSLIRGSMSRASATIDAYLIDTDAGEIVLNVEGSGSKTAAGGSVNRVRAQIEGDVGAARETLRPAIRELLEQILPRARRLPPPVFRLGGNVVGTGSPEGTVYIDRGDNFDVQPGQRFAVYRVLQEIRGTDGELLDQIIDQVGIVEVERVLTRSSVCRLVEGEAVEGDTVRAEGT